MVISAQCPRCSAPLADRAARWHCPEHGAVEPLRRPETSDYANFATHLHFAGEVPTYLPWPMSAEWSVSDFAVVPGRASMTCTSGTSAIDGPVDVMCVAEEPGTGLGARLAGIHYDDPGSEIESGNPAVRVRIDRSVVPLWPISTSATTGEWDRSVVAGEAFGRWLWLVLRPASAMLLLRDDWILRDASQAGPELVDLRFGGPPPAW